CPLYNSDLDPFLFRVRLAVAMPVARLARGRDEVDVGIEHAVRRRHPATDFQQHDVRSGAVLKMVAVLVASAKTGAVARAQHLLAFEHVDEFVFMRVPVTLRRPRSRRQPAQVDAELCQACRIAETDTMPLPAGSIERGRI